MLVAAALLGLSLFSALPQTDVPASLTGVKRIVFLGDSITAGGERPGGYVWLVRHYLNTIYPKAGITVINSGISGHKSTDMLARFDRDVIQKRPDLVFISVGVNDVWHGFYDNHPAGDGPLGIKVEDYQANVLKMVHLAQAQKARVFLMQATLIGEDVTHAENKKAIVYNEALRHVATETHSTLVDLQNPFRSLVSAYRASTHSTQNFLTVDGVHMNESGNFLMAQTVLSALGVPDKARHSAEGEVAKQRTAAQPGPGRLPDGLIVSVGKPATATSQYSNDLAAGKALLASPTADDRWCASGDSFSPLPWWQVDLGSPTDLTGVHLEFAPLDTWRYQVQTSLDGVSFTTVADHGDSVAYIEAVNIRFDKPSSARYLRVLFTRPTAESNWPSLRRVDVYAK